MRKQGSALEITENGNGNICKEVKRHLRKVIQQIYALIRQQAETHSVKELCGLIQSHAADITNG